MTDIKLIEEKRGGHGYKLTSTECLLYIFCATAPGLIPVSVPWLSIYLAR